MSKQMNFFILPNEMDEVVGVTMSINGVVILNSDGKKEHKNDGFRKCISLQSLVDQVVIIRSKEKSYVDVISSPVIELIPPYLDEKKKALRQGRIYIVDSYYDSKGRKMQKDKQIVNLYMQIKKIFDDRLKKNKDGWMVSDGAAKWVKFDGGTLLYY